jgi:threonine aldolase
MINLMSDTVTRPTQRMIEAMFDAEVGDDVFQQDPTINQLEDKAAKLLGMEAGIFCPSGTMTNQIAIHLHTQPLDEVLCDKTAHIYNYEAGAWAMHSGVSIQLLEGENGIFTAQQVKQAIRPTFDWLPRTRLVVIENTCNKAGGTHYTLEDIQPISSLCMEENLKTHLDGARLFNAVAVSGDRPEDYGKHFDTISICLSKGLGAPVGSLLLGDHDTIRQARRIRKALGGGMRQAGYLAAAGSYALDHHRERLVQDHEKAQVLRDALEKKSGVKSLRPGQTNIVIFDLEENYISAEEWVNTMEAAGIQCVAFGPQTIRFVTHLDVSMDDIQQTCRSIEAM